MSKSISDIWINEFDEVIDNMPITDKPEFTQEEKEEILRETLSSPWLYTTVMSHLERDIMRRWQAKGNKLKFKK